MHTGRGPGQPGPLVMPPSSLPGSPEAPDFPCRCRFSAAFPGDNRLRAVTTAKTPKKTANAGVVMMKLWFALLLAGLVTTGCATSDIAMRQAGLDEAAASSDGVSASSRMARLEIAEIAVLVPEDLRVSEANVFFPDADIVWREDPLGDRHEQVRGLLEDALIRAAEGLTGPDRVRLEIRLLRFHALTQKARYTTGGVHNIRFVMQLRDLGTDELIAEPILVNAALRAYGGQRAVDAEARGETQRARITAHVAEVVRAHLLSIEPALPEPGAPEALASEAARPEARPETRTVTRTVTGPTRL